MANLSELRVVVRSLIAVSVLVLAGAHFTAEAQTFTVLYNLGSHNGDPVGAVAPGIIAQGRDGNLYSTAANAGGGEGGIQDHACGSIHRAAWFFDDRWDKPRQRTDSGHGWKFLWHYYWVLRVGDYLQDDSKWHCEHLVHLYRWG